MELLVHGWALKRIVASRGLGQMLVLVIRGSTGWLGLGLDGSLGIVRIPVVSRRNRNTVTHRHSRRHRWRIGVGVAAVPVGVAKMVVRKVMCHGSLLLRV